MATPTGEHDFKDHFHTLQLHPEADARMVEEAYWHLARRYNAEKRPSPTAVTGLDELNEAYSVLGSPSRRKDDVATRNAVLGKGALPVPPAQPAASPPLKVLERTIIRARAAA